MPDVVCSRCGAEDGFYRNVEVTGQGWSDVEIIANEDGSIEGTVDGQVHDVQWDDYDKSEMEWGCSNCGAESYAIEQLFEVAEEEELDPVARAQKNPIKGQMTIDDALAEAS